MSFYAQRPRRMILLATATAVATACATLPAVAPVTPAPGLFAPAVAAATEVATDSVTFSEFSYYRIGQEDTPYKADEHGESDPVVPSDNGFKVTIKGGPVKENDTLKFRLVAGDENFYGLLNVDGTIDLTGADGTKIGEMKVKNRLATITFTGDFDEFTTTLQLAGGNFGTAPEGEQKTGEIKLVSDDGSKQYVSSGIWQKQGTSKGPADPLRRDKIRVDASTGMVTVYRGLTPGVKDNYDDSAHSYRIRMTIPKKTGTGDSAEDAAKSRWYSECGATPKCSWFNNSGDAAPTDPNAIDTDLNEPFDISAIDKKDYVWKDRKTLTPGTDYTVQRVESDSTDNYEVWEFYFPNVEANMSPNIEGAWIAPYKPGEKFTTKYQWGYADANTSRDDIPLDYNVDVTRTVATTEGVAEGNPSILAGPLASSKYASKYEKISAPRLTTTAGSPQSQENYPDGAPYSETDNKWEKAADADLPEWIGVNTETGEITATPPADAELKTWKFPVTHTWPDGSTEIVEAAVEIKSIDSSITPEYQGENSVAWTDSASVNVTPELIRNFATGAAVMGEFPGLNVTVESDNTKENFGEITVTPDFGYPAGQVQIPVKYTFLDATVATANATFTVTAGKLTNPEVEVTQGSTATAPAAMPDIETVDGEDAKTPQDLGFTAKVKPGEEVPDWLTFNTDDGTFTAAPGYTVTPGEYTIPVVYTKTTGEGDSATTVELESTTTVTVTAAQLTYSGTATVKQDGEATVASLIGDLALPEGTAVTVVADTGAPTWARVNADGSITVTPGLDVEPGEYEVPVAIIFGDGTAAPEVTPTSPRATATVVVEAAPQSSQYTPQYSETAEIFAGDETTIAGPAEGTYPPGTTFARCEDEADDLPEFMSVNEKTGAVSVFTDFFTAPGTASGTVCITFPDGTTTTAPVTVTIKPVWQNPVVLAAGALGVLGVTAVALMPKPAPAADQSQSTDSADTTDEVDNDKYDVGTDDAVDDDTDSDSYSYDSDSRELANTGSAVDGLAAMALALMLAGAALILGRRRRRS